MYDKIYQLEEKDYLNFNRLLKNAHLSRASRDFPHPSPCQARGRLVAAYYFKYASFVSSWASGFRLPARSRFGEGRGALHLVIFEQPAENDFLSKLLRNKIVFVLSLIVKPE